MCQCVLLLYIINPLTMTSLLISAYSAEISTLHQHCNLRLPSGPDADIKGFGSTGDNSFTLQLAYRKLLRQELDI